MLFRNNSAVSLTSSLGMPLSEVYTSKMYMLKAYCWLCLHEPGLCEEAASMALKLDKILDVNPNEKRRMIGMQTYYLTIHLTYRSTCES